MKAYGTSSVAVLFQLFGRASLLASLEVPYLTSSLALVSPAISSPVTDRGSTFLNATTRLVNYTGLLSLG